MNTSPTSSCPRSRPPRILLELEASTGQIDEWSRFVRARQELIDAGLGPVVEHAEAHAVSAQDVERVVERSLLEAWTDVTIRADDRLSVLAPSERDTLVERFRDLDRRQVANAAAAVINACAARRPTTLLGVAGLIRTEAAKKKRHMPIRTLLDRAHEVALKLKPCFMMSPLTVSQFLPPNLTFDVAIFDEASQVKPSAAINCIYRARQLIVAGDPHQLPPTSFFERTAEGGDEYIEEGPEDFESVLDVCRRGLPQLPLRWHYRSQHESLITYSNYSFYEGRLHTFPGASEQADDVGIELIRVDGVYRRGGLRDNPLEAEKVVERVLFHRRAHPDLTLGVVAFSDAQESAIEAALARHAPGAPELNELLTTDRLDGFFVKNLENVQGDERDIIIFSIGYGPDEHGKFTEQLGPLTQRGGERRLNVAITRARRRVEVVASISSNMFSGTSTAAGVRHLQRYLDFADRGMDALSIEIGPNPSDVESPFEAEVLASMRRMGYDAVPQVGAAGFRVDIGVRDPSWPGRFALGVECDGAAYHSSKVARDRDRLRQEVLEGLGWRIFRIWGPSWYHDRQGQERRLQDAIESAIDGKVTTTQRTRRVARPPVVESESVVYDERPAWVVPYAIAERSAYSSLRDLAFNGGITRSQLVDAISAIVEVEAPVHAEVLRKRISAWFAIGRMGSQIRAIYDNALAEAIRSGIIVGVDEASFAGRSLTLNVRVPTDDSATKRKVTEVPAIERREAIVRLVIDAHRIERTSLREAFARLFGWQRTGVDIQVAFEQDLTALLGSGQLTEDGSHVIIGGRS